MKQSNLISILILFFSLLSVQSVVAQKRVPDTETGTWYVIYDTGEHSRGGVSEGDFISYSIQYPNTTTLSFECWVETLINSNNGSGKVYETINNSENSGTDFTIEGGKRWTKKTITINT